MQCCYSQVGLVLRRGASPSVTAGAGFQVSDGEDWPYCSPLPLGSDTV